MPRHIHRHIETESGDESESEVTQDTHQAKVAAHLNDLSYIDNGVAGGEKSSGEQEGLKGKGSHDGPVFDVLKINTASTPSK